MDENFLKELLRRAKEDGIERWVVAGIILRDSKILLLKRKPDDFLGNIFELPSGKVEDKETLLDALHREVEEETGLKIKKILGYVTHFDYSSKSGKLTRQFNFVVDVYKPFKVVLTEHISYAWVSREEMKKYNITPNVRKILELTWNGNWERIFE